MTAMVFPASPTIGQIYSPGAGSPSYVYRGDAVWQNVGMGFGYGPVAFTATPGQTTIAVAYQVGAVDFFVEGVRFDQNDFVATNGTTIVVNIPFRGGETGVVIPRSVLSTLATPPASPRNLLLNSVGKINERAYVSGAAVAGANTYTLDRWKVVTSGQSLSWTEADNLRTMTAPAGGVEQPVEGLSIQTGVHTLSWAGSATATVNGGAISNGGQVALTGGANAIIRFIGGTFSRPQLELGTKASDFVAEDYESQLARCARFFLALPTPIEVSYGAASPAQMQTSRPFKVRMRISPNASVAVAPSLANCTSLFVTATPDQYTIGVTITGLAGQYGVTGAGLLHFNAEI